MSPLTTPRVVWLAAAVCLLVGCAREPAQNAAAARAARESALLPKENVLEVKVVPKELLGKPFMPGGTIARYQKGKDSYEIFLSELPSETDSAIVIAHWDGALKNPKVIRSLDAYYGLDGQRPVYVFAKGHWVAGITGLPEQEADQQARRLAGRL